MGTPMLVGLWTKGAPGKEVRPRGPGQRLSSCSLPNPLSAVFVLVAPPASKLDPPASQPVSVRREKAALYCGFIGAVFRDEVSRGGGAGAGGGGGIRA